MNDFGDCGRGTNEISLASGNVGEERRWEGACRGCRKTVESGGSVSL